MLTITVPPDVEHRLQGDARRQGMAVADYAMKLLDAALSKTVSNQASIDVLNKWERDNATDDPEEIARRQKEFEEFKEGMNRNRLEMEGPHSRKIYP